MTVKHRCRIQMIGVAAVALAMGGLAAPAPAQSFPAIPTALEQEDIDAMVAVITAKLLSQHDAERHWEPKVLPKGVTKQEGGRTALVCVALLDAGVPAQDEKLLSAITAIAEFNITGSYARAASLMIYARLPDKYLELAGTNLAGLIAAFDRDEGGWAYYETPTRSRIDNSIVQFCTLGLSDLTERGVRVPAGVFTAIRNRYLRLQGEDGGWGYKNPTPMTGSMTAAGIATLSLCTKHVPPNKTVQEVVDRAINRGIAWLDANFTAGTNPNRPGGQTLYWLFSAARAGQAAAVRSFGGKDWLCEGAAVIAETLLARKKDGTGWKVTSISNTDLAFALLFLTRGQTAVAFGSLVGKGDAIDPIGLGPAANAVTDLIEEKAVWQRVSVNDPIETWLRMPVVLVQGDVPPPWTDEAIDPLSDPLAARLMSYAKRGGLVLFSPTGRGANFVKAVKSWGERALPERTWKAMNDEGETPWRRRALSLGPPTRSWFVLVDGVDLTAGLVSKGRRYDTAVQALVDCWTEVTQGMAWSRREARTETPGLSKDVGDTGDLVLIQHDGEWNAEPLAAPRAAAWVQAYSGHDLWLQEVTVEAFSTSDPEGSVAWIRGVTVEEATSLDIAPLVKWIEGNGGLLIEQSGGSGAFATTLAPRLAAALDGIVVPAARPLTFAATSGWPSSVLAIRKNGKALVYVSTADCSICMLHPRRAPRGRGVEAEVTTAMLGALIHPKVDAKEKPEKKSKRKSKRKSNQE